MDEGYLCKEENSKLSKIKIKNLPINGLGEERGRKMSSDFLCTLDDLGD